MREAASRERSFFQDFGDLYRRRTKSAPRNGPAFDRRGSRRDSPVRALRVRPWLATGGDLLLQQLMLLSTNIGEGLFAGEHNILLVARQGGQCPPRERRPANTLM